MREPGQERVLWDEVATAFTRWRDDGASADELVRLMTPVLWQIARSCRLPEDASRDVLQDVWLALVRSRDQIEEPSAVAAWLITATRRGAWRARAKADPGQPREERLDVPADAATEDLAIARHERDLLWRAVAGLTERCQRLLRVIAFSPRPDYATLSRTLQMPVGSIGPTRGRCLDKLRALLVAAGELGTEASR